MSHAVEGRDARRSSRHVPPTPTPVVDAMSSDLLGFVMDLSAGGMKLMAGEALVDNALYQVQFEVGLDDVRQTQIEAGMQVVGQRRNHDGSTVASLRFIHMQESQARHLGEWLQSRRA